MPVIIIEWRFLRRHCTEITVYHSGMWMFCLCVKLANWMMWIQYPTGGGNAWLQSGPQVVKIRFLWPSLSLKLPIHALGHDLQHMLSVDNPPVIVELTNWTLKKCIFLFQDQLLRQGPCHGCRYTPILCWTLSGLVIGRRTPSETTSSGIRCTLMIFFSSSQSLKKSLETSIGTLTPLNPSSNSVEYSSKELPFF